MARAMLFVMTLATAVFAATVTFAAGSSGGGDLPANAATRPLAEIAASHFKAGLRHKNKAWKHEGKAANYDDQRKRGKYLGRAQKAYRKAIRSQTKALQAFPGHYEAANELGYALRKTGDYDKAINAYDYALELNPKFYQAIEYRAEALLALNHVDEVKQAYMELFRADRELARQLMGAMDAWLAQQQQPSATVTAFGAWVLERKTLAQMTRDLSAKNARGWQAE